MCSCSRLSVMLCNLQLSSKHSCLIWTTNPEKARHLLQLPTESFVDEVNTAFVSEIILISN